MPIDPERSKALEAAIASIERSYGKGAIMRLGANEHVAVGTVSSGSIGLDLALGIGGLPRGRVIEIYGPESSGKTTMTLHLIAETQKAGGVAAFIDAEHALDVHYARALGVNVEELLISQPDTGEQALEIADTLVRSGAVDAVIVDSVAALVPKAELEGEMGDVQPGAQARLMSQALRKLTANIHKSNCSMIFINQVRMKIGVMFGSPETTTGGNALKYYASIRLDIRRIGTLKVGEESIGNRTRVKVVKNKLAPPSGRWSSTSSTGRASTSRASSSTSGSTSASCASRAPGSRMARSGSGRVGRRPSSSCMTSLKSGKGSARRS